MSVMVGYRIIVNLAEVLGLGHHTWVMMLAFLGTLEGHAHHSWLWRMPECWYSTIYFYSCIHHYLVELIQLSLARLYFIHQVWTEVGHIHHYHLACRPSHRGVSLAAEIIAWFAILDIWWPPCLCCVSFILYFWSLSMRDWDIMITNRCKSIVNTKISL